MLVYYWEGSMTNSNFNNKANMGRLALLATTLIWGTSFVILKRTLDSVSTLYILAIRFSGAALLMLLFGIKDLKKLDKNYLIGGTLMGVLLVIAYIFQTYGLVYTTPGKNAFITASYCVLVPFLSWIIYKKKPDKYNVMAGFVCITGIGFVSLESDLTVNIGDFLTLVGGLFFGLHIIVTSHYAEGKSPIILTMVQFAAAAVISLSGALVFEPLPADIPVNAVLSIVYMCVMCTGICLLLQTFGQKYTPSSSVSILLTLESVFGVTISVVFYGEKLTFMIFMGFALIFLSVLLSETKLSFLKNKTKKQECINK